MVIGIVAQSLSIAQAFLFGWFVLVFLAFLLDLLICCLLLSCFYVVGRFIAFLVFLFVGGSWLAFILASL